LEASKEVLITYETLFDILRREKSNEELQKLDPAFFNDVFEYLAQKQRIYDASVGKTDLFSVDEREKTQMQLYNIRRVIKELYERREKKILEMALNKSKTNSNILDTSSLLASERDFFDKIVSLLDQGRETVLMKILELKKGSAPVMPVPIPDSKPEPVSEPPMPEPSPEPAQPEQTQPQPTAGKVTVKFLKDVEPFVNKDLETLGPYTQGSTAELSEDTAQLLINNGSAEKE